MCVKKPSHRLDMLRRYRCFFCVYVFFYIVLELLICIDVTGKIGKNHWLIQVYKHLYKYLIFHKVVLKNI